jgi:hypothetical protein
MLTDAPPRKSNRAQFLESERMNTLDLPSGGHLPSIGQCIESAMKAGKNAAVRRACAEFLDTASEFYGVPDCGIRVLAARPLRVRERGAVELFGDYAPDAMLIRVWMRTAIRKEVTSFGTFLSTQPPSVEFMQRFVLALRPGAGCQHQAEAPPHAITGRMIGKCFRRHQQLRHRSW